MILKSQEIKNINKNKFKIALFYGKNDIQKREMVDFLINENDFYNYEQNEIIDKKENFYNEIYIKSLFWQQKNYCYKKSNRQNNQYN